MKMQNFMLELTHNYPLNGDNFIFSSPFWLAVHLFLYDVISSPNVIPSTELGRAAMFLSISISDLFAQCSASARLEKVLA
tara:strand:- start:189 stop:428 length:240 start_codon:yes stop_codon:yes gene_type:complete